MFLFDENGNQTLGTYDGGANNATYKKIMGSDGILRFQGETIVAGKTTDLAVGTLEGVCDLGISTNLNFGAVNGQTVEIDGVDWVLIGGAESSKYFSAVRKA